MEKGTIKLVKEIENVKIYTFMSPYEMFANTSHIIELPTQLIIVDGQFFAPYAQELKTFTNSLSKPVTRFYISHEHPDHYIGFGDAFPDVDVYALKSVKEIIEKEGQDTLEQRQKQFGPIIAQTLNVPKYVQEAATEIIDGITFIFEESFDNESANSLVIKLPELNTYIAQDIVYNNVHLFISGETKGWKNALNKIKNEEDYDLILGGHGEASDKSVVEKNLTYLEKVDANIVEAKSKEEYKVALLKVYPNYAGVQFIDIYLTYHILNNNWVQQ
jgi:glyoxylase-like metal-dependent hydrolase (beta-lactamase superfamily II)